MTPGGGSPNAAPPAQNAAAAPPARNAAAGAQPTGSGDHVVRQGESLESIARAHGFLPDTLWNLPENAQLKQERKDLSMLLPGDRVHVPEPRPRREAGADKQRHKFHRKGLPSKLRVKVLKDGDPRKNAPYVVNIDGKLSDGALDGDGVVEIAVPPDARRGTLTVGQGAADEQVFELRLSGLDPIEAVSGVQQRLDNLGYPCPKSGELDEATRAALADFQRVSELEATGEPDQKTRDRLAKEHGA